MKKIKLNNEIKREFAISEQTFENKMNEIFLKLFNEEIREIIFPETYVINSDKKYHIKKLMFDRIKRNVLAYDELEKKYYAINKASFTTKYKLLDKILF